MPKVPSFHVRVKLHQEPVGINFVASSPNAPLTSKSYCLTLAFNATMPDIDEQWDRGLDVIPGLRQKSGSLRSSMTPGKYMSHLRDAIQLRVVGHQMCIWQPTIHFHVCDSTRSQSRTREPPGFGTLSQAKDLKSKDRCVETRWYI